jgi:hypothetical protein
MFCFVHFMNLSASYVIYKVCFELQSQQDKIVRVEGVSIQIIQGNEGAYHGKCLVQIPFIPEKRSGWEELCLPSFSDLHPPEYSLLPRRFVFRIEQSFHNLGREQIFAWGLSELLGSIS